MSHNPFDERGWPIRMEDGERLCARKRCAQGVAYGPSREFRINGYCSIACRDAAELERERDALLAVAESVLAWWEVDTAKGAFGGEPAMVVQARDAVRAVKERAF